MSIREKLVLVGGGHSHVEVLRQLEVEPIPGLETTVVADRAHAVYSGMVPGYAAGQYSGREISVDVAALAERAGARWLEARATGVDPKARRIELAAAAPLDYTLASLDVGSTTAGLDTPGVREYALASRPIAQLVERIDRLEQIAQFAGVERNARPSRLAVVGTGAAGIELACCVRERIRKSSGVAARTTLLEAGPTLLAGASRALRRAVEAAARRRDIEIRCNERVAAVEPSALVLESGERIEADVMLWVTGAAPHAFLRDPALPLDEQGFLRVDPTLQVQGHSDLFATGDCASFPGTRKAGVYAVRQGPVLAHNIRASLQGALLSPYRPQKDFLQLLNLGDGSAIAAKWGIAIEGRFAMKLKDRIDRAWIARYSGPAVS